ncbi:hypothetical protein LUZ60_016994 [Juncus effusus]|nr:hypothetical protein LUZ60_016994 [Juncus effusus]
MSNSKFIRPKASEKEPSSNLYVANCGPAVGLTYNDIKSEFEKFGEIISVNPADNSGVRVVISFTDINSAQAAFQALNGKPCLNLNNRVLHIQYSFAKQEKVKINGCVKVSHFASELGVPGIHLMHDFISLEEEKELLKAVDERPWKSLSKRRVQHYGYEFLYQTRNVDSKQFLGKLPSFVSQILHKIISFPGFEDNNSNLVDQLTVNEYPSGVGLSPHTDTHSAFEDLIFSLSLAGPCIMEFRKYNNNYNSSTDLDAESASRTDLDASVIRRAVFLPARSMLLMSGEGRYAWQHYIPHHKVDMVGDEVIRRGMRRVSFTFRKVRKGPCKCAYPQFCDSQIGLKNDN